MQKALTSICIVGGGTAGWMAATLLSSVLPAHRMQITLIESPDVATIGVGESTVPSIMEFLHRCQIPLKDFVKATSATFKLGIRFDDWGGREHRYFHPFGRVGKSVNGFDFYQVFLKSLADGGNSRWLDYSPAAIMAEQQRFMPKPPQTSDWVLGGFAHALHLDAVAAARYLRDCAQKKGVKRIEATVKQIQTDDGGFIGGVVLSDDSIVTSDFFIDCTGFSALLIEKALSVEYDDWSHYLPCNRAVVVQTKNSQPLAPFTVATAVDAGWCWKIPLQHRTGNGYVYSSQFSSDKDAEATLLSKVSGDLVGEPRVIPFVTGKRQKLWHKNCLALGLSSGFLEPLESTAIHLIYKTLVHFIRHFPDKDFDATTEQAFNRSIDADYQEIRDFIILHYCTATRADTPLWRWCQTMPIPQSLQEKLRVFRSRGQLEDAPSLFFSTDSWYSILEGMMIRPMKYHPLLDAFDPQHLAKTLSDNVQQVRHVVSQMPNHQAFIAEHCQSVLAR